MGFRFIAGAHSKVDEKKEEKKEEESSLRMTPRHFLSSDGVNSYYYCTNQTFWCRPIIHIMRCNISHEIGTNLSKLRADLYGLNTFYTVVEFSFSFFLAPSCCPRLLLLKIDGCQAANGITLTFERPSMHGLRLSSWNWNQRTWKQQSIIAVCTAAAFLANRTHMANAFHQSLIFKWFANHASSNAFRSFASHAFLDSFSSSIVQAFLL